MSSIYIFSPSSAIVDKAAFKRGVKRLESLGHTIALDPSVLARDTRFAGTDAERINAISRAAKSGADFAMVARGGYGLTRLLADLPYDLIAKAAGKGTKFIGFSDFTAFQAAVYAQTKAVTWHGPSVGADFGFQDEKTNLPDDILEACFEDLSWDQAEGAGWRLPKNSPCLANGDFVVDKATLWGGNLCVLTSLVGTPYFPKINNGILYLEDVAEHPYKIERLLTQLLYSGVLNKQKAIVLGQFTDYKLSVNDKGFNLNSVVEWLSAKVNVPILTGLPLGHVATKVILPFGLKASLTVEDRDALIYWG